MIIHNREILESLLRVSRDQFANAFLQNEQHLIELIDLYNDVILKVHDIAIKEILEGSENEKPKGVRY